MKLLQTNSSMKSIVLAILLGAVPSLGFAQLPYTFQPGQTISAAEINANFSYLDSIANSAVWSGPVVTVRGEISPEQTILENTGSTHIEMVSLYWPYSTLEIRCPEGKSTGDVSDPMRRILPPGCSWGAPTPRGGGESVGANNALWSLTYRNLSE